MKRNYAGQILEFDPKAAKDPNRVEQYEKLKREAEQAYSANAKLRRPKGKSAQSGNPQYIDWSEPSAKDMFADLMDGWLRESYEGQDGFDEAAFLQHRNRLVERAYFMRHTFINQGNYGTAFSASTTLNVIDGRLALPPYQVEDPGELAYHFIYNALPARVTLRAHSAEGVEEARLQDLDKRFGEMREALRITDEPVPPLPPLDEMA